MTNEGIFEGLKYAVQAGQPLKEAMMSFYSAGYVKEEIEQAAAELVKQMNQGGAIATKVIKPKPSVLETGAQLVPKSHEQIQQKEAPKSTHPLNQNVSYYGPKQENWLKKNLSVIILVSVLVLLLGILFLMIFFKNQIVQFLNSLGK